MNWEKEFDKIKQTLKIFHFKYEDYSQCPVCGIDIDKLKDFIKEEKGKSYREGRIKQLEEDIEQVKESLPYQEKVEDTERYWIPTQILMELEDDLKLLKSKLKEKGSK